MRLINVDNYSILEFPTDAIPKYSILSHTWGDDEVKFQDMQQLDDRTKQKQGFEKIRFACEQSVRDGLQWTWVDTCCIDKTNNTELAEAINSMFAWYRGAVRCYVYLSDVSATSLKRKWSETSSNPPWESAFRVSKWFTRGWTLQELLAPTSVQFFARDGTLLDDKISLQQQIHEVTGIAVSALRGDPLTGFDIEERFKWAENRKTTREEDWAYSLLGIFGVFIPPIYGEGKVNAVRRLQKEINDALPQIDQYITDPQNRVCLQGLRTTDPRDDKDRIEKAKGGLLRDSYRWVLGNDDFRQWRNCTESRLLWIKGDPGKGKTMLLCGIIDELTESTDNTVISFFLCQATDAQINNATAVLRGLIYMLIVKLPSLISHVRRRYDQTGKQLFEDVNAWEALSKIFADILEDPCLQSAYLIIDGLDECTTGLNLLLNLLIEKSSTYPGIKWIVSSRNWPSIEKYFDTATGKIMICLELNEKSISAAVNMFIRVKVDWLANRNDYNDDTRDAVSRYLLSNANDTFLWVALVCQELADISGWEAEEILAAFPPGLDALYKRMMDQIRDSRNSKLCKGILSIVSVVHRPITIDELASFVDMPARNSSNYKFLAEIIGFCGSFLTLRERTISFVHQSVKDFLLEKACIDIFPCGIEHVHRTIFSRSLQVMSKTLQRDIYRLGSPGFLIDKVKQPDPDPLAAARYSCVYWIDHLHNCASNKNANEELQDGGSIDDFLCQKYIYWLEALSLLRSMSKGIAAILRLKSLLQSEKSQLTERVKDACRFILYNK